VNCCDAALQREKVRDRIDLKFAPLKAYFDDPMRAGIRSHL
jgi:hypothetical protein